MVMTDLGTNSWKWGGTEPGSTYITGLSGTDNTGAWFTKIAAEDGTVRHGYLRSEQSWVYTPSFDLTSLTRPTVEFDIIYQFRDRDHGAVLQYSTDDGRSWEVLGNYNAEDLGSGIGWYTHDDIDASPGGQLRGRIGWAESSDAGAGNWLLARHRLEVIPLSLRDSVRFRFAVAGADALIGESEGIGIDNFWIGNRTKVVVVEEFSTEIMSDARVLHETITRYMDGQDDSGEEDAYASQDDALRITYYGFPRDNPGNRSDRLYQVNPEDVNARQVYYGTLDVPTAILEGDFTRNSMSETQDASRPPWSLNTLNRSALERPKASVSIREPDVVEENITITVDVALTDEGVAQEISGQHRLHIAIIERNVEISGAPSGQTQFRNVLRKMLPNAAGTSVVFNGTSEPVEVSVSWRLFSTYLSHGRTPEEVQLSVIAFIQNTADKLIYQAAISDISVQRILQLGAEDNALEARLLVYPNPSSKYLQVDFAAPQAGLSWQIVDDTGRQLRRDQVLDPTQRLQIGVEDLKAGIYTLLLETAGGHRTSRRIFIRTD